VARAYGHVLRSESSAQAGLMTGRDCRDGRDGRDGRVSDETVLTHPNITVAMIAD
jgi:hypothetical protein